MTTPQPVEPSRWQFPDVADAAPDGLVGFGADLEPGTLVHAYRHGIFPMPAGEGDMIAWWSPPERGVLELDELVVSRSLRRSCRRYEVTVDRAFDDVIVACATEPRPYGWISPAIVEAYQRLHRLGWAHSVETWAEGELVGGLYGVQIGGLFAGESMFHRRSDASKVALVTLVAMLEHRRETRDVFIDVQWETPHLATLGVQSITRSKYLGRLGGALVSAAPSLASTTTRETTAIMQQYLDHARHLPTGNHPLVPNRSAS